MTPLQSSKVEPSGITSHSSIQIQVITSLQSISVLIFKFTRFLGVTSTTIGDLSHNSGLSSGAIGGIIGGMLGTLILIGVAVTFYLLGRRNRAMPPNLSSPNVAVACGEVQLPQRDESSASQRTNFERDQRSDIEVGGRLRYPNDQITESGRLQGSN